MVRKEELDAAIDGLKEHFKVELAASINEIKNSIIESLRVSNENLQKRVFALEGEVETLKEEKIDLEKRVEAGFQHGRLEQIVIQGIPARVKHEDLEEVSLGILNDIKDQTISSRDISACHRLGKTNENTILRFVNRKDVDDCLKNRKKLEVINREAHGLAPGAKIYIRENMSPYMGKLAYYCRVLKRKNFLNKVTTFKGVVKFFRTVENRTVTNVIDHKQELEGFD